MTRPRKPFGEDRQLEVRTSGFGFEYDEEDESDDEVKWKVGWYQGNNPHRLFAYFPSELEAVSVPSLFTPEVCAQFAKDFAFESAQVAELARRIDATLDPDVNQLTLTVAQSDGERRGTAAVERGFKALTAVQELISDTMECLAPLRPIAEDGDAGRVLKSVISSVDQSQAFALEALTVLDNELRYKSLLYEAVVADKRQVGVARRTLVFTSIFEFWVWAGRGQPTYTSAANGRSGPLVNLCHAVFRLARTDGSTVSGDTIARAIKAWRKL